MLHYYGLDWGDAVFSMLGIYFLSRKNRIGFVFNAVGAVSGLVLFTWLNSYPFMGLNVILIYLNLVGYARWKRV